MPKKVKREYAIEFGIREGKKKLAAPLKPIVKAWGRAIKKYCNCWKDNPAELDVPYFYNERSNVSILAAASWLVGDIALEEYRDVKGRGKKGRTDLYMCVNTKDSKKKYHVVIEAKHKWMKASRKKFNEYFLRAVEAAASDARKRRYVECRVACVFFVPYFILPKASKKEDSRSVQEAEIRGHIDEYLEHLKLENSGIHLLAWCFPKIARGREAEKNNFYPGIIMSMSVVNGSFKTTPARRPGRRG